MPCRPAPPKTARDCLTRPNFLGEGREGQGRVSHRRCAIIPSASRHGASGFWLTSQPGPPSLPFRQRRRAMPRMAPTRAPTTSTMWQQHAALSLSRRQASSPAGARHARRACVGPSTKAKPQGADRPASAAAGANQHRTLHTARPSDCAPPPPGLEHARPCSQAASGLLG